MEHTQPICDYSFTGEQIERLKLIPMYQKEVEMCLLGNHELPDKKTYPLFHEHLANLKAKHEEVALKIERKKQEIHDEKLRLEYLQSMVSQGNARLEEMEKEMEMLKSVNHDPGNTWKGVLCE